MEIVRKQLKESEVIPSNIRYNSGTNTVQFSPDNGTTWIDEPNADPRSSDAFRFPPITTGDVKCDTAANMVKWIKDFLDSMTVLLGDGALALSLLNAAIPFYELITGGSLVLLGILSEVVGGLFDLGYTALLAAMDSTTYDDLLCILYCNIADDGTVSAFQFGRIESQITDQLSTTAGIILNLLLSLQGEVGLQNAGAIGSETGDCSACTACNWNYQWDFTVSDGGWFRRDASEGNYIPGAGWSANCVNGTAKRVVIQYNIPTAPAVTIEVLECKLEYVKGSHTSGPDSRDLVMREFSGNNGGGSVLASYTSSIPLPTGNYDVALTSTQTPLSVELNSWSSTQLCDGSALFTSALMSGSGTPPPLTGGAFI